MRVPEYSRNINCEIFRYMFDDIQEPSYCCGCNNDNASHVLLAQYKDLLDVKYIVVEMSRLTPGVYSLATFISSIVFFTSLYVTEVYFGARVWNSNFCSPILYFFMINIFMRFFLSGFFYGVVVRSTFLGFAFATGLYLALFLNDWKSYGMYVCLMAFFHFSEFCTTAFTNPSTLSLSSFILNHSAQYGLAAFASTVEWLLEKYFFPDMKQYIIVSMFGLFVCIIGELMRKGAMFTAKTNFNHEVQTQKQKDHVLVTHGIYSWFRHPSYVGWFYWAIGTQIVLINPICTIGFSLLIWSFFNERIYIEEYALINFFGHSYIEYQKSVSTGIPFIKGFCCEI